MKSDRFTTTKILLWELSLVALSELGFSHLLNIA